MPVNIIQKFKRITDVYTWDEVNDLLGEGAYAKVYCGVKRFTNEKYAVKHFIRSRSKSFIKRDVINESEIMLRLNHRNIAEFIESYNCENEYYLVFKLYTGGELYEEIIKRGKFTEKESKIIVYQITDAVNYLHKNGIIHRDVKPENILYESDRNGSFIKLIDYGVAKLFNIDEPDTEFTTFIASKYYVAPEMLVKPLSYSKAVDCWSIGIITHILLTGNPPYDGNTVIDVYLNIRKTKYKFIEKDWEHLSSECISFTRKLLKRNPVQRMSSAKAIKHKWLLNEVYTTQEIIPCKTNLNIHDVIT